MVPRAGEANLTSRTNPGRPARSAAAKSRSLGAQAARCDSSDTAALRRATSSRLWARIASRAMGELREAAEPAAAAAAADGLERGRRAPGQRVRAADRPGEGAGVERHRVPVRVGGAALEEGEQPLRVRVG